MKSIEPLSGWMLDHIVAIDEVAAGFAGHYLRGSNERRQVVAAFLSFIELAREDAGEVAAFLMRGNHDSILVRAFGSAPPGFRAALGRSGPRPHEIEYYLRLFDLLSTGPRYAIEAIWQSSKLGSEQLSIITDFPADLCDSRILSKIKDRKHATDVALSVGLLVRRGIDRSALVEALRRTDNINETVKRWSMRMAFPPGPIPATKGYRPICNGSELAAIARKYRNCVRGYFTSAMTGRHAFGEFSHDGNEVLISYNRTDGMWIAEAVYGFRNLDVHVSLSRAAFAFAARLGVPNSRTDRSDKGVQALRRLAQFHGDWNL